MSSSLRTRGGISIRTHLRRQDWSDVTARATYLPTLVSDARAALSLVPAAEQHPAVVEVATLLTKIVADDIEEGSLSGPKRCGRPPQDQVALVEPSETEEVLSPDPRPRLRRGVAPDRILSVVDPEMRWGHKSSTQRWAGYKLHVLEEPENEL